MDHHRGLTQLDWTMVALYGALVLFIGFYYSRRQTTTKEYFLAGGHMPAFAIGISMLASLISAISYLGVPGEMIKSGPVYLAAALSPALAYVVVGYVLIPRIMQSRVTSAYELLEQRLGLSARLLAALIFIVTRLIWMSFVLNVSAEALIRILDLSDAAKPWIVVLAGILAVAYTALGGLRAVVTMDVIQFMLMMGGALLTLLLITLGMNGFGWFPTEWAPHWDRQVVFSVDPHVRVTVVGTIVSGALWWICTAGSDQTMIQRFMATGDERIARRSFFVNSCADASVLVVLCLVGLALLGFYSAQPELAGGGVRENADVLFPNFIANQLPVGIAGLVVAALFAAAMSSVDSQINAVTAVVLTDFVGRARGRELTQRNGVLAARVLTVVIGIVIVMLTTFVDQVPGNYLEVTQKLVNLLVAPLFGLFFMALFVKSATPWGAVLGTLYGSAAAILVGFWDVITHQAPLSFQWISGTALAVNILAGLLFSNLPTRGWPLSSIVPRSVVATAPIIAAFAFALASR